MPLSQPDSPPSHHAFALLISIIIVLFGLGALLIFAPIFIFRDPDYAFFKDYIAIIFAALASSAIAVLAARLRSVRLGAAALIAAFCLIIPFGILTAPSVNRLDFLAFYVIPIMLTNLFFGCRTMLFVALVALFGMITVAETTPNIQMSDLFAGSGALFLAVVSILVLDRRSRDLLEAQHRAELIEFERLRVDLKAAHELDATKSHLMRTISHEFRTPLTLIRTSAELVERYGDRMSPEQRAGHFNTLFREIDFLDSMIEDIVTVTRLQSGRFQPSFKPRDLQVFCPELIAAFESRIAPDHLFVFESAGDLSAVPVEETLLRHILSNLLSNAAKYSTPGSEVLLRVENCGGELVITIRDHGTGIPEADRPNLFEPFFRGSNSTGKPGSGLGMKIVADSLRLYGGSITYETSVGGGTTFVVRLPIPPSSERPQAGQA